MAKNHRWTQKKRTELWQSQRQVKRNDSNVLLTDDVLLKIFVFYMDENTTLPVKWRAHAWLPLVHVCRQWRHLVFRAPRSMNLQLYCTPETPAKDTLDVWPALPLIIHGSMALTSSTDNVVAALGQSNRVYEVELHFAGWQSEEVLAAMQVPFPKLTDLRLWSHGETPSVIPESFLGGSAPRLRNFSLHGILFPGFPEVLPSATHLVFLNLSDIPHSGYLSPQAMLTPLSELSSLEILSLGFRSPQSRPQFDQDERRSPSPKKYPLPALKRLHFRGVTEYLEEIVTRIDTPRLDGMDISFFNQIDFNCIRLAQFINNAPKLRERDEAHVQFNDNTAGISLRKQTSDFSLQVDELLVNVSCREPDWQLSSVEQVCNSLYPPGLSTVEDLYIEHEYSQRVWKNGAIDNILWLHLLLPFTAVQNLYLSKEFAPGIAVALKALVGITEVLPNLQDIFVEGLEPSGSLREDFEQFVAARQLSGYPITISVWTSWTRKKQPRVNDNRRKVIGIGVLHDDVLLDIFGFYMNMYSSVRSKPGVEAWQLLIHICQRWRGLVFSSPRRLNLQLYCTPQTPAKDKLNIWPALPLIVAGNVALSSSTDNIIVALGQSNRVCQVELHLTGSQLDELLALMQVPFPELTIMELSSHDETPPVIPHTFFDGSVPRLQNFSLFGIPFPGLPKLLSSSTDLIHLHLSDIPQSGYISPESMVAILYVLSSLETLTLEFQSPQSRPDRETRSPPPIRRVILPALYEFRFQGVTEYLEELVNRIDTPQLDGMDITFFNRIDFDCPRLAQFINLTPKLGALDEAHVKFNDSTAGVALRYRASQSDSDDLLINIFCREPDWQLSSVEQICNFLYFVSLSKVEDLYIEHQYSQLVWKNDAIENTQWLQLFRPFISVKNLYLSKEFAPGIAAALKGLDGTTGVLLRLQNILVEGLELSGPFQENIGQFVTARLLSGRPIVISVW